MPKRSIDSIQSATLKLCKLYARFESEKIFSSPRTQFFNITHNPEGQVMVLDIDKLKVKPEVSKAHAPELALFFLDIMSALQAIQRSQHVKVSDQSMIELIQYLKVLISQFEPSQNIEIIVASEAVKHGLLAVLPVDKRDKLHPKIAELLGKLMMSHPNLRDFKMFSEVANLDQPIDRVVLLNNNDLADAEVLNSLKMLLKNHHSENIVVTFDDIDIDIDKVDRYNQSFNKKYTLHVLGGGTYRDSAETGGKYLADLVNKCLHIEHVRLSGCFAGLIREDANVYPLRENSTVTLVTDANLNMNNSPFESATIAVSCWNNIHKQKREISVTVSPGIIEPDRDVGRMTWKGPDRKNKSHEGIKEVRITTSSGPKNKEKLRLK